MSRILWALIGYALFVAAVFVAIATWLDRQKDLENFRARESILQARVAEAIAESRTDSVTVVRRVVQTQTLRDTLNIHDTTEVIRYLYQTDTLRTGCMACVSSAAKLRASYDSLTQLHDSALATRRPSWRDRVGVHVGYGATKAGSDLKVGPQVGVSVRVWP